MEFNDNNWFLSIIICVYNVKYEYLQKCLNSLLAQDTDNFKVIIIDDGSTDDSGDICDEYATKDPRFTVIHQANAGVSAARNAGLRLVDTEWVTFIDSDDWVENNYISTLYKAVCGYKADIFLFDYFQEFADKRVQKSLMQKSGSLSSEWVKNFQLAPFSFLTVNGKYYEYEHNTIWNKMYRISIIKNAGLLFDPRMRKGGDNIFNAEALQLTTSIYYIRACLYHYCYIQWSITNKFNPKVQYYNEVMFENYERIIDKYNLPEKYREAFYARVVTRLYSCMRLYYFHEENTQSKKEVYNALDETLSRYPYNEALNKVQSNQLTVTQWIFVFFLKKRQYGVLRMLVNSRQILKNIGGLKLK